MVFSVFTPSERPQLNNTVFCFGGFILRVVMTRKVTDELLMERFSYDVRIRRHERVKRMYSTLNCSMDTDGTPICIPLD